MIFKLDEIDVTIAINGVNYDLPNFDSVTIEDTEEVTLHRGNNGKDDEGIALRSGLAEPKSVTIAALAIPQDLAALINNCFENKTRIEVYMVTRSDGSNISLKKAIVAQRFEQRQLDETRESLIQSLIIRSFAKKESHKS